LGFVLWIVLGAVAGLIAGSFLAALVIRWPRDRAMDGRSGCDHCGRVLTWRELVPLLSYLAQRGRCTACGARIDPLHPVLEGLCAMTGAAAFAAAPGPVGATGAMFAWLLIALAALDLRHFWLPDRLTAVLAITGVATGFIDTSIALTDRLIGGLAGYATLAMIARGYRALRKRDGLGSGDPKLLGAIGLWLGWQMLPFVLIGACAVGLIAVLALMLRGNAMTSTTVLPFGTLLSVASIAIWLAMHYDRLGAML